MHMLLARFGSSSATSTDLIFAFDVSLLEDFSIIAEVFACGASANRVASASESSPGTPLLSFEHQTLPVLAAAAGTFSLIHGRDFSFSLGGAALVVAVWARGSAGAGGIGAFGGGTGGAAGAAEGGGGGGAGGTPAGLVVGLVLVVGDEVLSAPTATEARGLR